MKRAKALVAGDFVMGQDAPLRVRYAGPAPVRIAVDGGRSVRAVLVITEDGDHHFVHPDDEILQPSDLKG